MTLALNDVEIPFDREDFYPITCHRAAVSAAQARIGQHVMVHHSGLHDLQSLPQRLATALSAGKADGARLWQQR
jgi:hypothetical protein